jgi:hypothetical protein
MFRHPSYYKKLRERNKSDQTISHANSTRGPSDVRSGPGLKQQAIEETVPHNDIEEAQASSSKQQASSAKLLEPQATSFKRQA